MVLLTVCLFAVLCFSLQQLSSLPFIKELECAERDNGAFPLTKGLCRQHLFLFRGSDADIASLQDNQGAMRFVVPSIAGSTASADERSALLSFVARRGLDINTKEKNWTPLHAAVNNNDLDGVRMLLRLQPELGIKAGPKEQTPLEMAQAMNYTDIVDKLLAAAKHQRTQFVLGMNIAPEDWQALSVGIPPTASPTENPLYGID